MQSSRVGCEHDFYKIKMTKRDFHLINHLIPLHPELVIKSNTVIDNIKRCFLIYFNNFYAKTYIFT